MQTATATTKWQDLIVSDFDGNTGHTLGEMVSDAPANLDNATIKGCKIVEWPGFFISAPGEEPDWDTPKAPVDWTGFHLAIEASRGNDKTVEALLYF